MAMNGTKSPTNNTDRTLHIRYQTGDDEGEATALDALDRGDPPEPHFEVVFNDPDVIHHVTRPKNLELLRAIAQYDPESIRETARLVGRDVRPVHRNLSELESLHLINLVDEGQAKRPSVWYIAIDIDIERGSPEFTSAAEA